MLPPSRFFPAEVVIGFVLHGHHDGKPHGWVGQSKRAAVEFFKPGTVCFLPVDYGGGSFIIRFFVTNEFLDRMFLALMLDDELVVGFGFPIVDRCLIAVFITADGETEGKASNDPAFALVVFATEGYGSCPFREHNVLFLVRSPVGEGVRDKDHVRCCEVRLCVGNVTWPFLAKLEVTKLPPRVSR